MAKNPDITLKKDSQKDSTITLTATIASNFVHKHRQDSLLHLGADIIVKGFRKGKVPLKKLEEVVDQQKLTNHTLEHIFPHILKTVLKEFDLKVVGNPTLKAVVTPDNSAWTVTLDFPLSPEFKLGNYKSVAKKALARTKKEDADDKRLQLLLDSLLNSITLTLPESLVNQEVDQSLSRLFEHTQTLGISIDQYLKSLGKTQEQLKADYEKAATDNLKTEFILDKIATDLKIEIKDSEVDKMINASGDKEAKEKLDTPQQRIYIKNVLKKRKTIDTLLKSSK